MNVAQLRAGADTVSSNAVTLIVAERLDVTLDAGTAIAGPGGSTVASAVLTNRGNGREAFAVTAAVAGGAARVAFDADGDGTYTPADDPDLPGGVSPPLDPGSGVTVFVIVTRATDSVTIAATATTGSGAHGTPFDAAGDDGGDAVTGATGATASVTIALGIVDPAAPTLAKAASVAAPDGSTRAVPGAVITYTLIARFAAATAAPRISDAVPVGTAYQPGSLTLDDQPMSDATDADPGAAGAAGIAVTLADQPAGALRTIRFRTIIQ